MEMSEVAKKNTYEFGGPLGVFVIILFSHLFVYYLWISFTYYQGSVVHPSSFSDLVPFLGRMWDHIATGAKPTLLGTGLYLGFMAFQVLLAWSVPGFRVKGLPIPSLGNKQLSYICNGIGCWYITLITAFILHFSGLLPLSIFADHVGAMITVGTIFANLLSLWLYAKTVILKRELLEKGNPLYQFFMGVTLNPRIGRIDLKMFSEIRIPWILLFFLTLSAAFKQLEIYGYISPAMAFMILAHGLYTNACMKGEECIPTTWDIFHEKFGWMLIFWNYVGVPLVYCFQSFYILHNDPQHSTSFMIGLLTVLITAYYVWDTANSQKNRFRMQQRGIFIKRLTFPQLPWGTLKRPEVLKTVCGSDLLVDGWYRYARKIHYTADLTMAITWGLSCGFSGALPYLYPVFFAAMISHRYIRDVRRCSLKYGTDWDNYCKKVPYVFIPYIY